MVHLRSLPSCNRQIIFFEDGKFRVEFPFQHMTDMTEPIQRWVYGVISYMVLFIFAGREELDNVGRNGWWGRK